MSGDPDRIRTCGPQIRNVKTDGIFAFLALHRETIISKMLIHRDIEIPDNSSHVVAWW